MAKSVVEAPVITLPSNVDVDKVLHFFKDDRNKSLTLAFEPDDEVLTQQQWKDIVDVNNIVMQFAGSAYFNQYFRQLGEQVMSDASRFADLSNKPDNLQGVYSMVEEAKHAFVNNIPAKIREKFDNDAIKFYEFAKNSKNVSALSKMLRDYTNFVPPNATQLEEGNNQAFVNAVDNIKNKGDKA